MALSVLSQCHGVIRSRSSKFQMLKRAELGDGERKTGSTEAQESRRVRLLTGTGRSEGEVEEVELTPVWTETYNHGSALLTEVEVNITRLKELQKQRLHTAFRNLKDLDREINHQTEVIKTVLAKQS